MDIAIPSASTVQRVARTSREGDREESGLGRPKMMSSRLRSSVTAIAAVRLCAGVALGGLPNLFLRWEHIPPGSSMTLLMRTVGIRDLALGLGSASAVRSGS